MVGAAQEKRFALLGHRDTSETGLDSTRLRMFSSTQGRWLSTDPVHGCGQNPQGLNRYAYVLNSPTNWVDPRGGFICAVFCTLGCLELPPPFDIWCEEECLAACVRIYADGSFPPRF